MITKLFKEHRPLMIAGLVSFLCFIVTLALTQFDSTLILGINRWIKPMKFFISIAIFLWTIAIFLDQLKDDERFSRRLSWVMIAVFVIEMVAVTGQAMRGTTSHFNIQKPLDGAIFSVMGIAILINTVLVAMLLYRYFKRDIDLPPAILWGIRLGLILFLFGSIQGGYMSAQLGHTVGAPDGGPGLPIVNWSTIAGDLRIAHFLGLHSLQAVPLFAVAIERLRVSARTALTVGFAAVYFGIFFYLFAQALVGKPLLGWPVA